MIHSVYISIGTNKGDKVNNCNLAIKKLRAISEVSKISSFYKTSSWGYDDDFFINFVVQINTIFAPEILLQKSFKQQISDIYENLRDEVREKWGRERLGGNRSEDTACG